MIPEFWLGIIIGFLPTTILHYLVLWKYIKTDVENKMLDNIQDLGNGIDEEDLDLDEVDIE